VVGQVPCEPFFRTRTLIGPRALGQHEPSCEHVLMDLRDPALVLIPSRSSQCDHIQSTRSLRQHPAPLLPPVALAERSVDTVCCSIDPR
jgi:hypothetical protein